MMAEDGNPFYSRKVAMKSLILLWESVVREYGTFLGVDTTMDLRTAHRRVEQEGMSFLTITLPRFRKCFDRSLDSGTFELTSLTEFGRRAGLPRFLGGFLELVFDRNSGRILDTPNIDAIQGIRQMTGLCGSIFEVCDERRVRRCLKSFVETEAEVAQFEVSDLDRAKLRRAVDSIFGSLFGRLELAVYQGSLLPRHSGGATADRLAGDAKWNFPEWTDRLEEVFPFLDYTVPNHRLAIHRIGEDGLVNCRYLGISEERPVRVVAVPKTAEKARIISIEPSYMQYMQQAVAHVLMSELKFGMYSPTIQLARRESNQELACKGSHDGLTATVDLKDASDRLSWDLLKSALGSYPWTVRALDATRSREAAIDGLGRVPLAKFASMGSGLTFPIQTIVFTAVVFLGIAKATNTTTGVAYQRYRRSVRVFGDDIICPTEYLPSVLANLELYGFKINAQKTNGTGKFRESCGGEFYDGNDVSFVKVRAMLAQDRRDANLVASTVSLRNRLYEAGLWATASLLDAHLEAILRWYPVVTPESPLLGRWSFLPAEGERIDPKLQVPVAKGWSVKPILPEREVDDLGLLMRWFLESEKRCDKLPPSNVATQRDNRSGRPERVTLKLGKRPV